MSRLLRSVLIALLVLLPLRGWAQASMVLGGDCAAVTAAAPAAAPAADDGCPMHRADAGIAAGNPAHHAADTTPADDPHPHCVVCHLALAEPPALLLAAGTAVLHPCPLAAGAHWLDADPRAERRPPRG